MLSQKEKVGISLIILYSVALIIQWHTLLNWDVSLLMHASERLLAGGQYGIDFFDTDPPLILYLYAIPVIVAKIFSLSFVTTNYIYTFLISIGMLALCQSILKLFDDKKNYNSSLLLLTIAAIFLLVPAMNFAQREHLMVMFILPYLLITALRLQKIKINTSLALGVGFFAGVGFAIKPQFFIPFFMIEGYYFIQTKSFKKIRLETLIIIFLMVIYVVSILIFNISYITMILPAISKYYYIGLKKIMWPLLVWTHPALILSILPVCIYFLIFRQKEKCPLETILAIATLGFSIVYLVQSAYWYYHVIPAFSCSLLLLVQCGYRYGKSILTDSSGFSFFFVFFAILFIFSYPITFIYHLNTEAVWGKKNGDIAKLMDHLRILPKNTSIYFLSGCLLPYPAVDYLKLKDVQLAQTYWFLPGIVLNSLSRVDYSNAKHLIKNNDLLKRILLDLINKKPEVIVTDDRINCNGIRFQFLDYFLSDEKFKNLLNQYKKIDRFETVSIYRYEDTIPKKITQPTQ